MTYRPSWFFGPKRQTNLLLFRPNHSTCSVWEWKACFPLGVKFIPKITGKMSHTRSTRNKIPRPNPTIFCKMFPTPDWFLVWSGLVHGNLRFRVAPQVFKCTHSQPINWCTYSVSIMTILLLGWNVLFRTIINNYKQVVIIMPTNVRSSLELGYLKSSTLFKMSGRFQIQQIHL